MISIGAGALCGVRETTVYPAPDGGLGDVADHSPVAG
jgi:hypothetical protein